MNRCKCVNWVPRSCFCGDSYLEFQIGTKKKSFVEVYLNITSELFGFNTSNCVRVEAVGIYFCNGSHPCFLRTIKGLFLIFLVVSENFEIKVLGLKNDVMHMYKVCVSAKGRHRRLNFSYDRHMGKGNIYGTQKNLC